MTQIVSGKKIKSRREELAMTQLDLCQKADVKQPYLSRVERNMLSPSVKALTRIAQALHVSVDDLLEEERRAS